MPILVFFLLSFLLSHSALAQFNFTPLKEGEYEQLDKRGTPPSNVTLRGSYEASHLSQKSGLTGSRVGPGETNQEMILKFKSSFNENLSLNANISNQRTELELQRKGFTSERPSQEGNSRAPTGMNLYFREAYLEYNPNPNAALKIGYQRASIADRLGLVYEGIGNAITQSCRMGTWCYYIGAIQLGQGENDALFWGQINYPVFEAGTFFTDPWAKGGERQAQSLDIELFRVFYNANRVPLGKQGGWIGEYSAYHQKDDAGRYVYFDNQKTEYVGFNLTWNANALQSKLHIIRLGGHRDYWSETAGSSERTKLAQRGQGALLTLIDFNYLLTPRWKLAASALQSPGTKQTSAKQNYWDQDATGFQEVQPGYFGKALIYLNGMQKSGDGHSVNNLKYNHIGLYYTDQIQFFSFESDYYDFRNSEDVFDIQGIKRSSIGREVDLKFRWKLERNLTTTVYTAFFTPTGGYSPDETPPDPTIENFSRWGLHLLYDF